MKKIARARISRASNVITFRSRFQAGIGGKLAHKDRVPPNTLVYVHIATDFLSRTYPQKSVAAGATSTWPASERCHFNVDEDFLFKYFLQAPYKSTALISECFRMLVPC